MTTDPRVRFRRCTVGLALVGLAATCMVAASSASVACCGEESPPLSYDFDADGYTDLAIGAPWDTHTGEEGPVNQGSVTVLAGSSRGVSTAGAQRWTQDTPGVPGAGQSADRFGQATASGDFDGDDYADLAIGVPGNALDRGAVAVLYGSAQGLTTTGVQWFTQASFGVGDTPEPDDWFGWALSAGDLTGDGVDDLAVGVPGEDGVGRTGPFPVDRGAVHVLFGQAGSGLTGLGSQLWTQDGKGVLEQAEADDRFGEEVAIGELTGDDLPDLVVGVPYESLGARQDAGVVHLFPGSGTGPTTAGNRLLTQGFLRGLNLSETGDLFGLELAVGDFDGNGEGDLAVGAPGETIPTVVGTDHQGQVNHFSGSGSGIPATSRVLNLNTPGIVGDPADENAFGASLATGHLDAGPTDDLVIGENGPGDFYYPLDNVHVVYGSTTGLSATGSQRWTPGVAGVPGDGYFSNSFGLGLLVGAFDGTASSDLAIGAPYTEHSNTQPLNATGSLTVLYSTDAGVSSAGSQLIDLDSPGVPGVRSEDQYFGYLGSP